MGILFWKSQEAIRTRTVDSTAGLRIDDFIDPGPTPGKREEGLAVFALFNVGGPPRGLCAGRAPRPGRAPIRSGIAPLGISGVADAIAIFPNPSVSKPATRVTGAEGQFHPRFRVAGLETLGKDLAQRPLSGYMFFAHDQVIPSVNPRDRSSDPVPPE